MKYGIGVDNLTVFMTEVDISDCFFEENSGYDEIYYTFSDAMNSFLSKANQFGCWFYFTSWTQGTQSNAITIMASPDSGSFADNDDIEGPYRSPLVAYGIGRMSRSGDRDYIIKSAAQFSCGTCVVFDCFYDCGEYEICKVHSLDGLCFNVTPLNDTSRVKSGEQCVLRLLACTDDVCVFRTPKELTDEMHLPPKSFIPIGTYCSDISRQDTSAVITGIAQDVGLVSQSDRLQYVLTVKTDAMEVSLNIYTHYEIKNGDFIYAVLNDVSARF